jgi:hypothetical protein
MLRQQLSGQLRVCNHLSRKSEYKSSFLSLQRRSLQMEADIWCPFHPGLQISSISRDVAVPGCGGEAAGIAQVVG